MSQKRATAENMDETPRVTPATHVGVDGSHGGWVAALAAPDEAPGFMLFETFEALWEHCREAKRLLADMPIGLLGEARKEGDQSRSMGVNPRSKEERACDKAARKLLGRRACTIFSPPARGAMEAMTRGENYVTTSEENRRLLGKGLSKQAFNIMPKIRELDEFLQSRPEAQDKLFESHPELAFARFNGGAPLATGKRHPAGLQARRGLIDSLDSQAMQTVQTMLRQHPRKTVKEDDLLDALALGLLSLRSPILKPLPAEMSIPLDATGLPMAIWIGHP